MGMVFPLSLKLLTRLLNLTHLPARYKLLVLVMKESIVRLHTWMEKFG